MAQMISFCNTMLNSLARFLGSEPIIYVFGLICLLFIAKIVATLVFLPFGNRR